MSLNLSKLIGLVEDDALLHRLREVRRVLVTAQLVEELWVIDERIAQLENAATAAQLGSPVATQAPCLKPCHTR